MTNSEQPAFPLTEFSSANGLLGITKREYFAAMAMNGYMASSEYMSTSEEIARIAIRTADELLRQLEK